MSRADEFRRHVETALRERAEFATLVAVIQQIQKLVSNPKSSSKDIAEAIGHDAVLAAKLLRVVNSAVFGIQRRLSSIEEAVVIMGYSQIKNICSGMMVADFALGGGSFDHLSMWRHSLGTAAASEVVQKRLGAGDEFDLFVAGLMANIGRLILDQRFTEEYASAFQLAESGKMSLLSAEQEVFGVTHAEVGAWAAEIWSFEDKLVSAIRGHHGPPGSKYADMVNLAYVITQASRIGAPGDPVLAKLMPGLFKRLKVDEAMMDSLLHDVAMAYESLTPVFEAMGQTE